TGGVADVLRQLANDGRRRGRDCATPESTGERGRISAPLAVIGVRRAYLSVPLPLPLPPWTSTLVATSLPPFFLSDVVMVAFTPLSPCFSTCLASCSSVRSAPPLPLPRSVLSSTKISCSLSHSLT